MKDFKQFTEEQFKIVEKATEIICASPMVSCTGYCYCIVKKIT